MTDIERKLEPNDYDELGSIKSDRSLTVFDDNRRKGIIEIEYSWDEMRYYLSLSERYSDSAHLDALSYLRDTYNDNELPGEITLNDLMGVSSADNSDVIELRWEQDIEPAYPASGLGY